MMSFTKKTVAFAFIFATIYLSAGVDERKADHPIEKVFLDRQSKYSFHRTLTADGMRKKLMSLFEAGRWAASSYNNQPWRFVYGVHGTPAWDRLFNLIVPGNQRWVENAGAIILVVSQTKIAEKNRDVPTHSFDTGMAAAHILLQATHLGLSAHPMCGFDKEKARKEFKIPKDYHIDAIIAIGEPASKEQAKKELAERDAKPSGRKPVSQIACEGALPT